MPHFLHISVIRRASEGRDYTGKDAGGGPFSKRDVMLCLHPWTTANPRPDRVLVGDSPEIKGKKSRFHLDKRLTPHLRTPGKQTFKSILWIQPSRTFKSASSSRPGPGRLPGRVSPRPPNPENITCHSVPPGQLANFQLHDFSVPNKPARFSLTSQQPNWREHPRWQLHFPSGGRVHLGPEAEVWYTGPTPWRPAHRGAARDARGPWEPVKGESLLHAFCLLLLGFVCVCVLFCLVCGGSIFLR